MTPDRTATSNRWSVSGFKPFRVLFVLVLFVSTVLFLPAVSAQARIGSCVVSTQNPQLHAEGLAEPLGNILISCSGFASGTGVTGNFTVFVSANVTNRIDANNFTTQAVLSVDYGLGLTPLAVPAFVSGQSISFNGIQLTAPGNGSFRVQIAGIRTNVNQLGASASSIAVDLSTPLPLTNTHVVVGVPVVSLYATLADTGIPCVGSTIPATPTMTSLFATGTGLSSTRLTEGFTSAFVARAAGEDSGTRFVVTYSNFPQNAQLYVPDLVAGSDAALPTRGGDLGGPASGGQYLPSSGTLLLARVIGADSNGAGGTPVAAPTGSSSVSLDSVTAVPLTNGAGYAVYEVIDSNPGVRENAQFPTFVGLPGGSSGALANEAVSLGPASEVGTATATDSVPRFVPTTPLSDCGMLGDCQAYYFPKLNVASGPVTLTATAGGGMTSQPGYLPVSNAGGGTMIWSVTVNYVTGSGWLQLVPPPSYIGNGSLRVYASAQNLTAGIYQANIVVNAGVEAGSQTIPVTLTVQAASSPAVMITDIVNAATSARGPLVAGSIAALTGTHLSGNVVTVTVGGLPAVLEYKDDTLIYFQVPLGLGSQSGASVVVTVDGVSSEPVVSVVAPAAPTIFARGVRNQDWSENSPANPAAAGSMLQIFTLGIPAGGVVTGQIGAQGNLVPQYAAAAPNVLGLQQVNLAIPSGLGTGTAQLTLCVTVSGTPYCSTNYALAVD